MEYYTYRQVNTGDIVQRQEPDPELEEDDKWELLVALQNTQMEKDEIIHKG